MLLEAKGSWELAEKAYTSLLEDNPLDQVNSLTPCDETKILYNSDFYFLFPYSLRKARLLE